MQKIEAIQYYEEQSFPSKASSPYFDSSSDPSAPYCHFIKRLRVLEFTIDTRNFDFLGAGAEIDRYCLQNDVAPKEKNRIHLAVEELVQQILLPRLPQGPIRILLEHSEREERTAVTVFYAGERFDPKDTENKLSFSVLKSTAADIAYEYDAEKSQPNIVKIQIKYAFGQPDPGGKERGENIHGSKLISAQQAGFPV